MGFYAAELAALLYHRRRHERASPWTPLDHLGIHPEQINRFKVAVDEPLVVAALPVKFQAQLRDVLHITPPEWARLMAAHEADVMLRVCLYHGYAPHDALNTANAVFATALKDRLAQNDLALPPTLADALDTAALDAAAPMRGRHVARRMGPRVSLTKSP